MTDRRILNPRYASAHQALAPYRSATTTVEEATDRLLADLRHLLGSDPAFQDAVEGSRLLWHGEALAAGMVGLGTGPRDAVWRQRLETERIGGVYWNNWPSLVKDVLVQRCVDIEYLAMNEQLEALKGHAATWNPQTGETEPPSALTPEEQQARITAYRAVLDQYAELEAETYQATVAEQLTSLDRLGYTVTVTERGNLHERGAVVIDPATASVNATVPGPLDPIRAADTHVLAELITAAERLPPVQVHADDPAWARASARHEALSYNADFSHWEPSVQERVLAALATAQTRAINQALPQDWVWDPRLGFPVPLPGREPAPLSSGHWAAIDTAKRSIDTAAIVRDVAGAEAFSAGPAMNLWERAASRFREAVNVFRGRAMAAPSVPVVDAEQTTVPEAAQATAPRTHHDSAAARVALAFPDTAPPTQVDTSPASSTGLDEPRQEAQP